MVSSDLKLIRGTVQELTVYAGEEDFVGGGTQQAVGSIAAVGLAAAGPPGVAVGASIAATARDPVEFFSCTIGGEQIAGAFSRVTFKDGDEVEVVVEPQWDGTEPALAVRRANDRTLWMAPHCVRGSLAHRAFSRRLSVWLVAGFLVFSVLLIAVMMVFASVPAWKDDVKFFGTIYTVLSFVAGVYGAIRFFCQWKPLALRAETAFAALGYRAPSWVDLEKDHKRACRALGKKWPYLSDGPWIYRYPREGDLGSGSSGA